MLILCGAAALAATWLVFNPIYQGSIPGLSKMKRLTVKAIPTALAALFAAVAFFSGRGDTYALLIFIALCVCTAADVLLGVRFIVGGAFFLTGHVLYITALGGYRSPTWWSLPVFVLAFIGLWLFLGRYRDKFPSRLMYLGVLLYCAALGLLLGFSLPLPFLAFSRRSVLAALGAALFVLSDMGTCHCILSTASKRFDFISLGIYYTGQILLGMSAFI